jgi:hypothetical protein
VRHPYTPIFRDLLDSSLWASASPPTRCVWITFLLDADPEGCIPTSVPGLARRAHVTVEEARAAIAMLEAPDPDSRTPDYEGRRVEKVAGGWRVLNFVAKRELAKHEAEKARKRKWANENGKRPPVANDNDASMRLGLDATSETLDAPKPKPKPSLSEERSSPTPPEAPQQSTGGTLPAVIHRLSEWRPREGELDGLRAGAVMAGVRDFDRWFKQLGAGPIGGTRGVLHDMVGDYIQSQYGRWKGWEDTERAKASQQGATGPSRRFGSESVSPPPPTRERVQGAPDWVYVEHANFANNSAPRIDVNRAAKAYARQAHINPSCMRPVDIFQPFMKYLENLAAQQAKESA